MYIYKTVWLPSGPDFFLLILTREPSGAPSADTICEPPNEPPSADTICPPSNDPPSADTILDAPIEALPPPGEPGAADALEGDRDGDRDGVRDGDLATEPLLAPLAGTGSASTAPSAGGWSSWGPDSVVFS